mmetsp:Transcript_4987/g.14447  ORF Transcript_4987/g.14447 Transcript_4987/m.14447 type:complete len:232 (+) Transcript_4987:1765-2460(+)
MTFFLPRGSGVLRDGTVGMEGIAAATGAEAALLRRWLEALAWLWVPFAIAIAIALYLALDGILLIPNGGCLAGIRIVLGGFPRSQKARAVESVSKPGGEYSLLDRLQEVESFLQSRGFLGPLFLLFLFRGTRTCFGSPFAIAPPSLRSGQDPHVFQKGGRSIAGFIGFACIGVLPSRTARPEFFLQLLIDPIHLQELLVAKGHSIAEVFNVLLLSRLSACVRRGRYTHRAV